MCTVSWLYDLAGYQIFFNRDEQRSRQNALPPQIFISSKNSAQNSSQHKQSYIMPVDPQGNGTWMGATTEGICVCLLNFYQGALPQGPLISRGILVKTLLELISFKKIEQHLNKIDCTHYSPFTLLIFNPLDKHPLGFCWDGKTTLTTIQVTSPFTSSGVDFPTVSNHRQQSYAKLLGDNGNKVDESLLLQFHKSHLPQKSMNSVCMHRNDAKTVSLSQIKVNEGQIDYRYWDGAPCETKSIYEQTLDRAKIATLQN